MCVVLFSFSIPAETNDEDLKQIDSEIPEKLDNTASEVGIVEEVETEKEEESKEEEHDTTGEENEKDVDDEKQVERIIERTIRNWSKRKRSWRNKSHWWTMITMLYFKYESG